METAVNFLMDGRPMVGERVVVFGQGIVGLLTTALLAAFPLSSLVSLDRYPLRRGASLTLGAKGSFDPHEKDTPESLRSALNRSHEGRAADLVFELSGDPQALNAAINITGFGGRVVIGSWYGARTSEIGLGGFFHRRRIRLISSQVSTVAPEFSGRWSKERRIQVAWDMIKHVRPAHLITHRFGVDQAGEAYQLLDRSPGEAMQIIFVYE
jgi:threonine dehydrogenase-like Zn-dependent dehydrogenase